MQKIYKLLTLKYNQPTLCHNLKLYKKGCNISSVCKKLCHKLYGNFWSLPIPSHWQKYLLMKFMTSLLKLTNWKDDNYNSILVIIDRLTNMVYYEPIKTNIDIPRLVKVIIDMMVKYLSFPNLIVTNRSSIFSFKFQLLFSYFSGIKRRLFPWFQPQTNGQRKRKNNIIELYFQAFVNLPQNDLAKLLPMTKFIYNNTENAITGHMLFELNYGYQLRMSFKKNINPSFYSEIAYKLVAKL